MTRVVSLFLPSWSVDRHRRKAGGAAPPAEAPLALIGRDGRKQVVLAADAAAHRAGVRVGMPATQARVIVPDLIVHDHDAAGDADALDRLALWVLQRYAPIVAADAGDGLVIDSTGADHLHGGEEVMLAGLIDRLAASGVRARAAIADTWGAAHALARFDARPVLVAPIGHGASVLAGLPLAALRLPTETVSGLQILGFERIGDLLAQPRAPFTLRFGPQLGRRIDQALGMLSEPIEPVRPDELIEVKRNFAEPISAAETIARYIGKLVVQLCAELEAKGLGAKRLDFICHRVDKLKQAIRVGTALPVRDVKRLSRLLTDKIETIEPGFGIETLSLTATLAEPLAEKQTLTVMVDEGVPDVSDLVDTLINRVGERSLYRAAPVATEVPERSVCRIAPMAPETGATWPSRWPRPSRLLAPPELIDTVALLPDHPPVSFTWRGIRRRVRRADGPERIRGEWWRRDAELAAVRDYFRVEDDAGERYWIFRSGDGEDPNTGSQRWFMHGVFG
ncbi:DNA polymerase Y family protein [Mesorhizobium sp. M8A.F.Ca.ET.208.01.1.1]|uniref:Y-family DNA polymerase n=1 Tax=unclassified Mesorhizobium TaxID=325217 RepID=UPI000F7594ED|nr:MULTISPECIES: DNA polymerase Y family protein [unclassified Mesorhizobium]AZO54409.1 DNA polymerase Y family protein [Mesorhizobium sp. M8A.F.Ca.ET.057.01.1.1]RWE49850.1 MAG: DNA polymerase Y family protein [Mesorhizobium sp.]TGQ94581.1 DNA polymerase Y family protein [Mesorhizobium sp. M8A.F.Ca.ET.208.01.1.1]TGT55069.1 DNA polymerase Y family protein [Mesorhizobium sp. M8A.F.Ca.ET.167.01.1.1]